MLFCLFVEEMPFFVFPPSLSRRSSLYNSHGGSAQYLPIHHIPSHHKQHQTTTANSKQQHFCIAFFSPLCSADGHVENASSAFPGTRANVTRGSRRAASLAAGGGLSTSQADRRTGRTGPPLYHPLLNQGWGGRLCLCLCLCLCVLSCSCLVFAFVWCCVVLSCLVLSCVVLCCLALPCLALPCLVLALSCLVLFFIFCTTQSNHISAHSHYVFEYAHAPRQKVREMPLPRNWKR
jgi:hypothetical protein